MEMVATVYVEGEYVPIGEEDECIEIPACLIDASYQLGAQRCRYCGGMQVGPGQPIEHDENCICHPDYDEARHDKIMRERCRSFGIEVPEDAWL